MRRRRVLLVASAALLPGCIGDTDGQRTDEPAPPTAPPTKTPAEPTSTAPWTPGGTGAAGPGSTMLEVTVADGFAGNVTLTGTCAGPDDTHLQAGETVRFERESAGGGCAYVVDVNGSERARGGVSGYQTAMVDVDADGSVDVSTLSR